MKKRRVRSAFYFAVLAAFVLATVLSACGGNDASKTDLQQPQIDGNLQNTKVVAKAPDSVVIYVNADQHPNIVKLCIEGLAFRTVSSTYASLATPAAERVPEWDKTCPAK